MDTAVRIVSSLQLDEAEAQTYLDKVSRVCVCVCVCVLCVFEG